MTGPWGFLGSASASSSFQLFLFLLGEGLVNLVFLSELLNLFYPLIDLFILISSPTQTFFLFINSLKDFLRSFYLFSLYAEVVECELATICSSTFILFPYSSGLWKNTSFSMIFGYYNAPAYFFDSEMELSKVLGMVSSSRLTCSSAYAFCTKRGISPLSILNTENSRGTVSGTFSNFPISSLKLASQGLSTFLEILFQSSVFAVIACLIRSLVVSIDEQILIILISTPKQPLSLAFSSISASGNRSSSRLAVRSMTEISQKRYSLYFSQMVFQVVKTYRKELSTSLCKILQFQFLNNSSTSVGKSSASLMQASIFWLDRVIEWQITYRSRYPYNDIALSFFTISRDTFSVAISCLTNACPSSLSIFFLLRSSVPQSLLQAERQQYLRYDSTNCIAGKLFSDRSFIMQMMHQMYLSSRAISSICLPCMFRYTLSMTSRTTADKFSIVRMLRYYCEDFSASILPRISRNMLILIAAFYSPSTMFLLLSTHRNSMRQLAMFSLSALSTSSSRQGGHEQTTSRVSLRRPRHRAKLTRNKYPASRGSNYLPRSMSPMASRAQLLPQGFSRAFMMQMVSVSIISIVSRGSLYFLSGVSAQLGGTEMQVIISAGNVLELVRQSRSLGLQVLSWGRKSGQSRRAARLGLVSRRASSCRLGSLQLPYQLILIGYQLLGSY